MKLTLKALPLLALGLLACATSGSPDPAPAQAPNEPSEDTAPQAKATPGAEPQASEPSAQSELSAPSDVAGIPADATVTASGLGSKILQKGTGTKSPGPRDRVKVHYTGWTTDGKMFDSSVVRGRPLEFGVHQVIKGWTEALQLMVEGEKRRIWIPADLAYGEKPLGGRPAGMLVFDVELLGLVVAPPAPEVPEDVSGPPEGTQTTETGLAYRVLRKGQGQRHPISTDNVEVHYSGWTTDGQMFDSSVVRGQTATFPLNRVIKGWTEGVQLMVEGEKTRFWIPAELAYGDNPRPGAPQGMLVFDIELIAIAP